MITSRCVAGLPARALPHKEHDGREYMGYSRKPPLGRSGALWAAGVSALALLTPQSGALAQDEDGGTAPDDRIVVTGSRIASDGMAAPVPITVVQADAIEALSPGPLVTGVTQLPQFAGSETPNSGDFFTRSGYGSLNLRGLGVNRTLTLLDGRRMPAASAFGGVDINLFPESMIRSVETVTGGASAAYGSDAVAGVVNFILDTDFTGIKMSVTGGVTDRGDGENYELSGAYGTDFAGGRGHFQVSGEYFNQEGIFNYDGRDWYQAYGTFGAGTEAAPYRFVPGTVSANASFDGRIFAPGTAINGLAFDRDGNVAPFEPGTQSQFGYGIPPARTAGNPALDDLSSEVLTLYPDLERYSVFAYGDYELSDSVKVFAQYIHGRTEVQQYNAPRGSFGGTPTTLTIFQDNAFLPDDLRQTMASNNIQSFTLRRMGSIEDIGNSSLNDRITQHIATVGLDVELATGGLFDGWDLGTFYQYGHSQRRWKQRGLRVDRIFAAVDAVDDGSGNIVCRTSLFGDAFPGCQPINLFGRGNASAAAVDYVTSFEPGQQITTDLFFADDGYDSGRSYSYTTDDAKVNLTTFEQHYAEVSASGEIVDLWAGPLAAAFGGSFREDSILQLVQDVTNPASDHESGHPVLCSGEAPGLRGVSAADCANTVGVQYSKVSNIKGSSRVWEAFGELLMPLVDTDGFTANANVAARWANYSGSGSVWAYKGGIEFGFADSLRLRGTYSRDVRAGNLSERFDKTGGTTTITDPRPGFTQNCDQAGADVPASDGPEVCSVTRFSGGNPAVAPEEADTFTVGAVFTPDFLPGLALSLDYYDVSISGAIGQVGTQEVVNRCLVQNVQQFCDLVTLDPNNDTITLVGDVFVNVAESAVRGLDFEGSYRTPLTLLGGDEDIGVRLFSSWLLERSETDANGNYIDRAGQTGARQGDQVYFPYADFRATASLTYRNGGLSALFQARHIGSGIQDVTQTEGVTIENNRVSPVTYLDLRLGYSFDLGGTELEVFGNVTNLGDAGPPVTPSFSAFTGYARQHNAAVYDLLGRRYTLGVKLRM
ncbi:hypothetical protein D2V17_05960 [Aurantiacibacter xanthus]|uniref:TonB-dependent receptor n=2 Tax=Aurantiacibacter xanthus TaxID=1784712 RepID=A0A3A1P732_9SPHN|nr:hypothetical protein D2V17_05960 [Aurantiacibacter xanthus]